VESRAFVSAVSAVAKRMAITQLVAEMASVAEQLRSAREAQHLTVQQIAEITNVRADHIRAIEEGNYDVFSAPIYIRGFVRSYCKILKLDPAQVVTALNAELNQTEKFSEPPPLSDQPVTIVDFVTLQMSKINWRKALIGLLVIVLVLVAYGFVQVWRSNRKSDPLTGIKPGIYQPTQDLTGQRVPLPAPAR
jgi:cytoskeleton protein RodZ